MLARNQFLNMIEETGKFKVCKVGQQAVDPEKS